MRGITIGDQAFQSSDSYATYAVLCSDLYGGKGLREWLKQNKNFSTLCVLKINSLFSFHFAKCNSRNALSGNFSRVFLFKVHSIKYQPSHLVSGNSAKVLPCCSFQQSSFGR